MIIKQTEYKLLTMLAEYGRINEDDIEELYNTRRYMQRRIKQLKDEGYIKETIAIAEQKINKEAKEVKEVKEKKQTKKKKFKLIQLTAKGRRKIEAKGVKTKNPTTTSIQAMEKQKKQSRLGIKLNKMDIAVLESEYKDKEKEKWFEISTIVKRNDKGLSHHSRIIGILYSPGGDYAIYNVGDGKGKWYISEEGTILNLRRHNREINKMIVLSEGKKVKDIFKEIQKNSSLFDNQIQMLSILEDNETGYEMINNITQKDWKKKIVNYILKEKEIKKATQRFADFKYKDENITIMIHNCLIKNRLIKNYQIINENTRSRGLDVTIICLEKDLDYYKKELPNTKKIVMTQAQVNKACQDRSL